MKTNLKLLVSSALVSLVFAVPQKAVGMEDNLKSFDQTTSFSRSSQAYGNSIDDFLNDSPLYHQVTTERYRSSVQTLRQEMISLHQNVAPESTASQVINTKRKIDQLTATIALQDEALEKYGKDQDVARDKITKEIQDLEESIKGHRQDMINEPEMKELYQGQINTEEALLETCKKYLDSLKKSKTALQRDLEGTNNHLKKLDQQNSSSAHTEEMVSQKKAVLINLYKAHVRGLCDSDVFPDDLPKVILESSGIPSSQLHHVHGGYLFQLFARTMELPYAAVQTGEEKEKAYLKQLDIVKRHLNNRIQEDIFYLQLGISMAQNKKIILNFKEQNAFIESFLSNSKGVEAGLDKNRDLEALKGVFVSYGGYGEQNPSQLAETILGKSSYGLLGLYIASLESPVTSWSAPEKVSSPTRLKDGASAEEFSSIVLETVFSILGRHINLRVLDSIQEKLQGTPEKPSTPRNSQSSFFV